MATTAKGVLRGGREGGEGGGEGEGKGKGNQNLERWQVHDENSSLLRGLRLLLLWLLGNNEFTLCTKEKRGESSAQTPIEKGLRGSKPALRFLAAAFS